MDNMKENLVNNKSIVVRYTREELLKHLHDCKLVAPTFSAGNNPKCVLPPLLLRNLNHFMEFQLSNGKTIPPLENLQPLASVREYIVTLLEFYFSSENLKYDGFLKAKDRAGKCFDGWVVIEDLLRYQRIRSMTMYPKTIAEAAKYSNSEVIEYDKTKGKIRRKPPTSMDDEGANNAIA